MALETLKNVEEIGGFKVIRKRGGFSWDEFDERRKEFPISIVDEKNMVSFRIQKGPVNENGVNGCQVDTLIEVAKIMLEGLNKSFPCRENAKAITRLDEALLWLLKRKLDREARGVEGKSLL